MTNNGNSTLVPKNQQVPISAQRSATKQLERAKRQAILMQIVEQQSSKGKTPTFQKLSEMMRKNSWVQIRWPAYTAETARRDFGQVMSLTRSDVERLAMPYLARQLGIIDETVDALKEMVDDDRRDDDTRIKAANSLRGYVGETAKIFAHYAPKETHVKEQKVVGTIDDFLKLKNQAQQELKELKTDDTIIDGDSEEIEEGHYTSADE